MEIEKLQDKIYDAYYSESNKQFRKKVRERIHWICENIHGYNVLDVGCSQGITAILLGREGKKVFAIDSSESAISDAKQNLEKEDKVTQNLVHFQKENFMIYNFEEKFDTVILGEVLEHINDVYSFFSKAVEQVKDGGKIIVTTPFGINDFVDHKRTFYLHDFLQLQTDNLKITDITFFGKWIGVIYEKSSNIVGKTINNDLLVDFEQAIYDLERGLLDHQSKLIDEIKKIKSQLIKLEDENKLLRENKDYKEKFLLEKKEKANIQKTLIEQYNKEEQMINDFKELSRQYEMLQHRYNNIKNSTLGKLTLKYWNWRNKRGRK